MGGRVNEGRYVSGSRKSHRTGVYRRGKEGKTAHGTYKIINLITISKREGRTRDGRQD